VVVMPKTELWQCQNTENHNLVYLPYKPEGPWDCVEFVRTDEVARLNTHTVTLAELEGLRKNDARYRFLRLRIAASQLRVLGAESSSRKNDTKWHHSHRKQAVLNVV